MDKRTFKILFIAFICIAICCVALICYEIVDHEQKQSEANVKMIEAKRQALIDEYMTPFHLEKDEEVSIEKNDVPVVSSPIGESKEVPSQNGFFSYMDADAITSVESDQYKLKADYVLDQSGIWTYDGRYCVAVGSYYTQEIGKCVDVYLQNGNVITCILADCKDDKDTDITCRQNPNGSVIEFIVNESSLSSEVKKHGNCTYAYPEFWLSEIDHIEVY